MLNQILKYAALATAWAKIKPIFWGTFATAVFIFTVIVVQTEFVEFLRANQELSSSSASLVPDGPMWLVFSYLGKFLLIFVSSAAYVFYLKRKGCFSAKKSDRFSEEFEFLLTERPLRSRGQVILDAKPPA
jgi:hypothetical protein